MIALADAVVVSSFVGLAVAALIALWRIVAGPSLADRVIALDLALVVLMVAIAIDGIDRGDTTWFNLLVVIAIVGFTATVAATQFIERAAGEASSSSSSPSRSSSPDGTGPSDQERTS